MSKLRLMYSSNAPWVSSGYGVQSRSICPRLAELPEFGGRDSIGIFAWYGLNGGVHMVDGFKVYPAGMDAYGNDIIEAHTKNFGANIVISLMDVWVLKETHKKVAPALFLPWLPIDHDPVPGVVLKALEGCHLPLTYSKWGQKLLAGAGVDNTYIPHGIETSVFRVDPDREKIKAFKQTIAPDANHLTVMVAANKGYPDRKAFQVQLRGWAKFAKDKPGAKLYMHTEPTQMYGGIDFPSLLNNLGIADRVYFPQRYDYFTGFPAEYLAMVYNAADMLLGASMSEGFGIPLIEAQACGCPVVTTDFSAMPELVRWGYAVAPADMFWTALNSWQAWPDWVGIWDTLEKFYNQWHTSGDTWPLSMRLRAQEAIHSEYSWDTIVRDQWAPLMTRLVQEAPPLEARYQIQMPEAVLNTPAAALEHVNGREAVLA